MLDFLMWQYKHKFITLDLFCMSAMRLRHIYHTNTVKLFAIITYIPLNNHTLPWDELPSSIVSGNLQSILGIYYHDNFSPQKLVVYNLYTWNLKQVIYQPLTSLHETQPKQIPMGDRTLNMKNSGYLSRWNVCLVNKNTCKNLNYIKVNSS